MRKRSLLLTCMTALITIISSSCDKENPDCPSDNHTTYVISNESYRTINFHFYGKYPDTTIGEYNPKNDGTDGLSPGENFIQGSGRNGCWEAHLKGGKKILMHVFDQDSLEIIPWDTVRATGRGLLERRIIDLEYLRANNFTVIYQ